ncbi:CoA-disulfide reductase [Melissococcus plutonius]|nr:CoA-disulfide reductase [Melissococcus plutonius]
MEKIMEIVIIGGIAAGMSAAAKAIRTNKEAIVTVIEKANYISFGACGLPYYLGDQFKDEQEMFARTPEQMKATGIQLMLEHEVTSIDFENKELKITNLKTKQTLTKSYDRLLIATGSTPIVPKIKGLNMKAKNIYTIDTPGHVQQLKEQLDNYQNILIIGGGFIGLEVADQLAQKNKQIQLLEANKTVVNVPFDPEFSEKIAEAVTKKGVNMYFEEVAQEMIFKEDNVISVKTTKREFQVDAVIMAVGVTPNTAFVAGQLDMLTINGAIIIDDYGRTSIPDVFAAGDCAKINHRLAGTMYIPLATTANKLGRIVGENLVVKEENMHTYSGSLASIAIKAGDYEAAATGINETKAKELELNYKTTCIETMNHSNYYSTQEKIMIKLVYDADTFVLYGAQLFGKNETVLRATAFSTAIYAGLTTKELGFVDYAYAPPFASTWEAINVAANTAK